MFPTLFSLVPNMNPMNYFKHLILIYFIFCVLIGQAQSTLSLDSIMKGYDYIGHSPNMPYWNPDSQTLYFTWKPDSLGVEATYALTLDGQIRPLPFSEIRSIPSSAIQYSSDYTQGVYQKNGDLFLYDIPSVTVRQLTATSAFESNPSFSKDGKEIIYTLQGNLYRLALNFPSLIQLTDFKKDNPDKEKNPNPETKYLRDKELDLFQTIRSRKITSDHKKALKDSIYNEVRPKSIYTGGRDIQGLSIDPNFQFITYILSKREESPSTKVPNYLDSSGFVNDINARAKVGFSTGNQTLHCYDILHDSVYAISFDSLPGIFDKPGYLLEYHRDSLPFKPTYDKPKSIVIHSHGWSKNQNALFEIKSEDNKDRWIITFDPHNQKIQLVDHQRDSAWIGGPGISGWNGVPGQLGWFTSDEEVWYISEKTGYAHLYKYNPSNNTSRALTSGKFEVMDVQLSRDNLHFYLKANADGPFEQHYYKLSVKGGHLEKLTPQKGFYEMAISPDETYFCFRHSQSDKPWEIFLMKNEPAAMPVQITSSGTPAFEAYPWRTPEIIYFKASDGESVPARIYRPEPSKKNNAAIIFVHGAGYLQNVHAGWSSYYREYMFHNLLCDEGYTILDIDYRASSGYGRDWRTAIYRSMGSRDLDDHIDGAAYLVDREDIDASKIGIYGGSYGGFITLMALFKYPGVFACGAALRSVTDWAHYNHPYTSNILNTPLDDSLAYQRSSPIYFAEGLEDPLLILHGMVDVNVQFQDVARLNQRLIELGKDHWQMALFPMEDHGFKEADAWTDEYKRIYNHFKSHLH